MNEQNNVFPILELPNKDFFYIGRLLLNDSELLTRANQKFLVHANSLFFLYSDNNFGMYKTSLFEKEFQEISDKLVKNKNILLIIGGIFDNVDLFNNQEVLPNIILCKDETIVKCNGKTLLCLSGGFNKNSQFTYNIYTNLFGLNQHCFDEFNFDKIENILKSPITFKNLNENIDGIISPVIPKFNKKKMPSEIKNYFRYTQNDIKSESKILPLWMIEYNNYLSSKVTHYVNNVKNDKLNIISSDISYSSISQLNFESDNKNITWVNNPSIYSEILISELSQTDKKKKPKILKAKIKNS